MRSTHRFMPPLQYGEAQRKLGFPLKAPESSVCLQVKQNQELALCSQEH